MERATAWIGRIVLAFLYVPIIAVIVYSFNASDVSYHWKGLSLRWYRALFADTALLDSLRVSVIVGVCAATAATVIGVLTAAALVRPDTPGRRTVLGLVSVPLIVPEIVLGVALLSLFSSLHITLGLCTLVIGHVVLTLPMSTLVMMGAMSSLDPSLPDAAADLGTTGFGAFRRVVIPLLRPAIGASWLLAFTTSFGNIVMSTFTNGVGSTTMPLRVYSLLKTGLTPEINALGALLIAFTVVVVLLVGVSQLRNIVARTR
ncbi:MAG: ABC transporter permease subunit [Gordonia sp. (in: high G+C Gram-positive bacteria)]